MNIPSILIVDDEAPARQRLSMLLADIRAECPNRVVGEADGAQAALDQIASSRPDIVLLDVQMPGMSGIELAQHLIAHQANLPLPAIIFITAYDEFAVHAFDVHALDYLLKPVRAARLAEALARTHGSSAARQQSAVIAAVDEGARARRHFSVLERGRILLVPVAEAVFLRAEQKYVTLRTRQRDYLLEESLTSIEEELGEFLVRVHRNALVARNAIAGVERATHILDADCEHEKISETWQVILAGTEERLPISRRQWPVIKGLVRS